MRLLTALPILLIAMPAPACEVTTAGDLSVERAWSRASIGSERPGVFYATIRNDGTEDDVLLAVATPAAAAPTLHQTVVTDGVARMAHAASVPLPAGETVRLEPGGLHAMLTGLAAPLEEGATFPVTFTFERAGAVTVEAGIVGLAGTAPACG